MKAILKFNLPEERPEFEMASNAIEYSVSLSEIFTALRSLSKYGGYNGAIINDLISPELPNCISDYIMDNQTTGITKEQREEVGQLVMKYIQDNQELVGLFELRSYLFSLISDKIKEEI